MDTDPDSPLAVEDEDPYGLEFLESNWQPPQIGVVRQTVQLETIGKGKYVVMLAPDNHPDNAKYAFIVDDRPLWLGRVSRSG